MGLETSRGRKEKDQGSVQEERFEQDLTSSKTTTIQIVQIAQCMLHLVYVSVVCPFTASEDKSKYLVSANVHIFMFFSRTQGKY